MSEEEIKLDRYAKFRRLGRFQEYVVKAGDWRGAEEERADVSCGRCMRACVSMGGRGRGHVLLVACTAAPHGGMPWHGMAERDACRAIAWHGMAWHAWLQPPGTVGRA